MTKTITITTRIIIRIITLITPIDILTTKEEEIATIINIDRVE